MLSGGGSGSALRRVLAGMAGEMFAVAWSITENPDTAVAAVHTGVTVAVATAPAHRPTRAEVLATVVADALGRATASDALPAGLFSADAQRGDPSTESDDDAVPEAASAEGLATVARMASGALAPADRAVLALTTRLGLDGAELAAVLDRSPGTVSADVQAARDRAEHLVGSVVFAVVGRDACDGLADVLSDLPATPLATDVAARVSDHVASCVVCSDRRRGLVAVASLLAAVPIPPAPPSLLEPAIATTVAPSARRRPRGRRLAGVAAVAVVVGVVAGAVLGATTRSRLDRTVRSGRLLSTVAAVELSTAQQTAAFTLRNDSAAATSFRARPDVPWLSVSPPSGLLAAGATAPVTVTIDRTSAPEGSSSAQVRVTSPAGDAVVRVTASVARAPVLGALTVSPTTVAAVSCPGPTEATVTVPVAEESGLGAVTLHWKLTGRTGTSTMTGERTVQKGTLGPFAAGAVTWWVTATDVLNTTATSPQQTLTVTPC